MIIDQKIQKHLYVYYHHLDRWYQSCLIQDVLTRRKQLKLLAWGPFAQYPDRNAYLQKPFKARASAIERTIGCRLFYQVHINALWVTIITFSTENIIFCLIVLICSILDYRLYSNHLWRNYHIYLIDNVQRVITCK